MIWADNTPFKCQIPPDKTLMPGMWRTLLRCCTCPSKDFQSLKDYCYWTLLPPKDRSMHLKIPCISDTRPRGPCIVIYLNVSSVMTSFNDTKRIPESFQRMESTNNPTCTGCLWTLSMTSITRCPYVCSTGMHTLEVTNNSLIWQKIISARGKLCLVLES